MSGQADLLWTSPYTCGSDGLQHEITDAAFHAARAHGVPLTAVCGHEVRYSAAIAAPGRTCRACLLIVAHARNEQRGVRRLELVPGQRRRNPRHRRPREPRWNRLCARQRVAVQQVRRFRSDERSVAVLAFGARLRADTVRWVLQAMLNAPALSSAVDEEQSAPSTPVITAFMRLRFASLATRLAGWPRGGRSEERFGAKADAGLVLQRFLCGPGPDQHAIRNACGALISTSTGRTLPFSSGTSTVAPCVSAFRVAEERGHHV